MLGESFFREDFSCNLFITCLHFTPLFPLAALCLKVKNVSETISRHFDNDLLITTHTRIKQLHTEMFHNDKQIKIYLVIIDNNYIRAVFAV